MENRNLPVVRERAGSLVQEQRMDYLSPWAAIDLIAPNGGSVRLTINGWVERCKIDKGALERITTFVL